MRPLQVFVSSLVISFALFAPQVTFAATANFFGPIIDGRCKCDTATLGYESAPDWGCVLQTLQNIVNLAISLGVVFGIFVIAYGGLLWMTSSVNPHGREQAKTMLQHAVIGLLIALSAWLIVDFVMKVLYNPSTQGAGVTFGPWNNILADGQANYCLVKREPPQAAAPSQQGTGQQQQQNGGVTATNPTTPTQTVTSGNPEGCTNCVRVSGVAFKTPEQNGCRPSGGQDGVSTFNPPLDGCYVNSSLLSALQSAVGNNTGWRVTESWPPTRNHNAVCHSNGTCVDIARASGSPTVEQIEQMAGRLKAQGLYGVFESNILSATQCQQIINSVGAGNQLKIMNLNSSPHFSVYQSNVQSGSGCIGF